MNTFDFTTNYTTVEEEIHNIQILSSGAEEEPSYQTQTLSVPDENSVDYIVIKVQHEDFQVSTPTWELPVLEKPMLSWVTDVTSSQVTVVNENKSMGIVPFIKPYLKQGKYTVVLFSDTPLITKKTVQEMLEFTMRRNLSVCKGTRSYIFLTEYIRQTDEIYSPQVYYFEEEDFMIASNFKQLSLITETLKNRILHFHMHHGVYIQDPSTTYIGPNVQIGKGSIVSGNVTLQGTVEIGQNTTIAQSYINDAKVGSHNNITRAQLENCVVGDANKLEGCIIGQGTIMGDEITVKAQSVIEHCQLQNKVQIGYACLLKNGYFAECFIDNGVKVVSLNKLNKVRVMPGAKVLSGATLVAPVVVGEQAIVSPCACVTKNVSAQNQQEN